MRLIKILLVVFLLELLKFVLLIADKGIDNRARQLSTPEAR
jgi:hypothetical protein